MSTPTGVGAIASSPWPPLWESEKCSSARRASEPPGRRTIGLPCGPPQRPQGSRVNSSSAGSRLQALAELASQRRVRGDEAAAVELALEPLGAALLARVEHRDVGGQLVERAQHDVQLRGHGAPCSCTGAPLRVFRRYQYSGAKCTNVLPRCSVHSWKACASLIVTRLSVPQWGQREVAERSPGGP